MKASLTFRKILTVIATFAVLFNTLATPLTVIAQEATPEPTPEATTAPAVDPTVEPTLVPTDTPIETATATVEPVVTLPPTDSATPVIEATVTPSVTESPTPSNQPIDQLTSQPVLTTSTLGVVDFSGILSTDKADYAPSETVIITGTELAAYTTYQLLITSIDNFSFNTEVTTDSNGSFVYFFSLGGVYRPTYNVEVKNAGGTVTKTTFTDSPSTTTTSSNAVCLQDNPLSPKNLVCTANDVSLGSAINLVITGPHGCRFPGDTVQFTADYQIAANATSRYNVGVYFGTAGQASALTGPNNNSCSVTSLPSSPAPFFDGGTSCGGINSGTTGQIQISMTAICNPDANGLLRLPYCTSWQNSTGMSCSTPTDAVPETKSKCNCQDGFTVPISVPKATVEVVKVLSPASDSGKFNLQVNGTTSATNVGDGGDTGPISVTPGSTTVGEIAGTATSLGNYTSSVVCKDKANNNPISTTGSNPWTLTTVFDQNVLCTITNTINNGSLTVIKHVINDNGGLKVAGDFTIGVSNGTPSSFAGSEAGTSVTVAANASYNVTEGAVTGYTASYSADCTGTMPSGGSKTCTVTNNDNPAHLIVIKHVITDNGGTAVAGNFSTTISGVSTANPTAAGVESPGVNNTLTSVGSYSVDEGAHAGYTKTLSTDCSGTIALGETKTCTITNDDIQPKLTVTKVVENDNGGTKVVADFPLFVNATGVTSGVQNGFNAGAYTVSETQQTGYTQTGITGDCASNGNITLALGDDKSCTITNNDNAPSLTLVKHVTNNNGGTASASNWTLTATGPTSITGSGGATSGSNFSAGTYALSESAGPSGYSASVWTCTGGTQNGSSITLGIGQSATCDITNDDIGPSLTLVKHVLNNDGGNNVAANWTLTATGPTSISGAGGATSGANFSAGTYALSESGSSGYIPSSWTCTGGLQNGDSITVGVGQSANCEITNDDLPAHITLNKNVLSTFGGTAGINDFGLTIGATGVSSGQNLSVNSNTSFALNEAGLFGYSFVSLTGDALCPQVLGGTVTLNEGQSISCTITNHDVQPQLTVIKHVNNDNGGLAVAGNFTMNVTGTNVSSSTFAGSESGTTVTLNSGTYSVDENFSTGYSKSLSADCSGSISIGQHKTCTITNDDQLAHLIVIKHVLNENTGATTLAGAFTMHITGTAGSASFPGAEDPGVNTPVNAGTFLVSEDPFPGYYIPSFSGECSGTIANGETKTCTLINIAIPAQIKVIKTVINDNGGTKQVSDFPLFVDGNSVVSDVYNSFAIGPHTVSETPDQGYLPSVWGGACDSNGNVNLSLGESKICTITNDDLPGTLIVKKVVINDSGGTKVAGDFYFDVNSGDATQFESDGENDLTVPAGIYNVSEVSSLGYHTSYDNCSDVVIPNGGTATCTITNNDQTRGINITKSNDKSGGISAGNSVGYTLTVTNSGEVDLYNVDVNDTLPGGFTYVSGSSSVDGSGVSDPLITGNKLTWHVQSLPSGNSTTITYQATTSSDLSNGTYTNFATCEAQVGGISNFIDRLVFEQEILPDTINCNTASSNVTIGQGQGYGGNLNGQVLGASTELPATGSPIAVLAVALGLIGAGLILKKKYVKN